MRDVEVHVFARGVDPVDIEVAAPASDPTSLLVTLRVQDGVTEVGRLDPGAARAALRPSGADRGDDRDPSSPVERDGADLDAAGLDVAGTGHGGPDDSAPAGSVEVADDGGEASDPGWLVLDRVADAGGAVEVGVRLFEALFTPGMAAAWRRARADGEVRLRLVVDVPEVARLPWELLHDPVEETSLALAGPLVRDLNVDGAAHLVTATPPVRVLVAVAGPDGVDELDGEAEVTAIRSALDPLVADGRIQVATLERATLPGLTDALREDGGVDVLHLVGHGRRVDGQPTVVLEDDWRGPVDVTPGQLRDLVSGHDLSLVFLNVCGALAPGSDGTDDFARALVHGARIPALVGMQTAVPDDLATQVARDFYGAIADLRPVDVALTDARRLIGANEPGLAPEMALPVCWLRSRDVALFPPVVQPPAPWWRWPLDHPLPGAAALVATLASVVFLWQVVAPLVAGPEPMGELSFNVAVASFTGDAGLEVQAAELADRLYAELAEDLDRDTTGLAVELRGPDDVGTLAGDDQAARADAAADVAQDLHADVVVDARLVGDGAGARFVPTFWVADRRLLAATELTGAHPLGPPERFRPGAVTDVARLQDVAAARTGALADLVAGLSLFATGDAGQARDRFDRVIASGVLGGDDAEAVLEVFRGKAAARAGDVEDARARYEAALALDADDGRAAYGLAEVAWDTSRGSCTAATIDPAGLARADQAFADVPIPTPDVADLAVKVDYARGRLSLCQRGAGRQPSVDVTATLDRVVAAHATGNDRVRGLAGLAEGLLAVQAWQLDGNLDGAVPHLQEAIRLATTDAHEALQWESLACLHLDRGAPDEADEAFEEALQLTTGDVRARIADDQARGSCAPA